MPAITTTTTAMTKFDGMEFATGKALLEFRLGCGSSNGVGQEFQSRVTPVLQETFDTTFQTLKKIENKEVSKILLLNDGMTVNYYLPNRLVRLTWFFNDIDR